MVYLTLFAGLFPLATIMSWFFNIFEIRSDMFKLSRKLYIRSIPLVPKGIGMWITVIKIICILSIFSNLTFFAVLHDNKIKNNDSSYNSK